MISKFKSIIEDSFIGQTLMCLALGMVAAFGMAPAHCIPALIFGYSGFLCVFHAASLHPLTKRKAFTLGACFGFGYFLINLNWIGNALLVDGSDYEWAYPFAIAGLPLLLSFFYGFAALVLRRIELHRFSGYIAAVLTFALFDWLRGHVFTGFPWNLPVHSLGEMLPALQILAWVDLYALNLIVLLFACSGLYLFCASSSRRDKVIFALSLTFIAGGVVAYGYHRLEQNPITFKNALSVKVIQPNVPQSEKWKREHMEAHFETLLKLSEREQGDEQTLIVWPETAINSFMFSPENRRKIQNMLLGYPSADLITGMLTFHPDHGYGNATVAINQEGDLFNITDKTKLVPFGEFIPFQNIIPLKTVTQFQGFQRGSGQYSQTLINSHNNIYLTYASLICYEILFPNLRLQNQAQSLDVIVNVTNDAWYGDSAGPRQHLWHARFRAIEHGVPVIRSANTGISAVFDSYGRVVTRSLLGDTSRLKTELPVRGRVLSQNKGLIFWAFVLGLAAFVFMQKRTYQKERT